MKTIFAIAVMAMSAAGLLQMSFAQQSNTSKHESPLAWDRLTPTAEQRRRHFDELGPTLRSLKTGFRDLPDGFEFQFPSDMKTYQLLAEWVAGERVCCPFFDIELRSDREGGPVWLRLTGREGVKQFMAVEGASWLKP